MVYGRRDVGGAPAPSLGVVAETGKRWISGLCWLYQWLRGVFGWQHGLGFGRSRLLWMDAIGWSINSLSSDATLLIIYPNATMIASVSLPIVRIKWTHGGGLTHAQMCSLPVLHTLFPMCLYKFPQTLIFAIIVFYTSIWVNFPLLILLCNIHNWDPSKIITQFFGFFWESAIFQQLT